MLLSNYHSLLLLMLLIKLIPYLNHLINYDDHLDEYLFVDNPCCCHCGL
ncbi:hypothetical protein GLYMA_06G235701v4 [Glycine max]|nr:hypothetical protein GLYMA_06G235701v4 [Glycine max]KAH1127319.1 hypothetical protein GYH30_016049 [Glycine max]